MKVGATYQRSNPLKAPSDCVWIDTSEPFPVQYIPEVPNYKLIPCFCQNIF